ncbi:MAG: wax ester/triacylglycerol synthase family O-acyltransferase [Halioglobus sp.]|nr:wax ester/triacylglycerol synthase family O-acyltransferase [Halioglobus sp.]
MIRRLSGQDASFLYTETPTVLMHTLKIQIFDSHYSIADYDVLRARLEAALDVVPMLRQRVLSVPFNLHHPVIVDDPEFDLDSHIYRAALPAPGGMRELEQMISQIVCHRLDRFRPMWELWVITGLENDRIAVIHKIHHCLADGAATVRYLSRVFESQAHLDSTANASSDWQPEPLPGARRLVWDALKDHFTKDIRQFPAYLATMWRTVRNVSALHREGRSPTVEWLTRPPPRTRFNHVLSAQRSFSTLQLPLADVKVLAKQLEGTVNDVLLALAAGAIRRYLLQHGELPAEPLCTAIPVSADAPGERRERGNHTTYLPTCLWTNIPEPRERFHAIQRATSLAKQELDVMGKETFVELMHFMPPSVSIWKTNYQQRKRKADRPDYRPRANVIISNVSGPTQRLSGDYGTLVDIYSMGPLVEACGLNITVWSYAGNLNFSLMGCKKAIPDIDLLAQQLRESLVELQSLTAAEADGPDRARAAGEGAR